MFSCNVWRLAEDDVADLFPPKAEVVLHKLSNRAAMYGLQGGNPLFFDLEGRGETLVPSVYALWKVPQLLEALYTYSEVSPKVCPSFSLLPRSSFASIHQDRRFCICWKL